MAETVIVTTCYDCEQFPHCPALVDIFPQTCIFYKDFMGNEIWVPNADDKTVAEFCKRAEEGGV